MATQSGVIQLKGRVGNLSFYKTGDGYAVRKASGVDGNKVKNHPSYARTRENMAEFGEATKSAKLFRTAFADDVRATGDASLSRRLTSLMSKLLRQDAVHGRGERKILHAATAEFEGFAFNSASALTDVVKTPFEPTLNRATGSLSVDIPVFSPRLSIARPEGATHFILSVTAAELDFEEQKFVATRAESPPIAVDEVQHDAISLQTSIPGSLKPLFLAFGISFVQIIHNGLSYVLKTSQHSVMQVLKVDTGVVV